MKEKKYTRLTLKERCKIEAYLAIKKPLPEIARLLNRDRSTIWREVNKWVKKPSDRYRADLAHWYALDDNGLKRRDYCKIQSNSLLRFYIYKRLILGWTAQQIANRLPLDYPDRSDLRISHESIYVYIYTKEHSNIRRKLIALLPYKKVNRKRNSYKTGRRIMIKDRVSIRKRPKDAKHRKTFGHWEGDLIIGKDQRSAIGTLVERKSRYLKIVRINSRKSKEVTHKMAQAILSMPDYVRQSLTYDNGVEMAEHSRFTKMTNMPVFFADPFCSWQRGTNENTNGLIRRFFPRKTDFNKISDNQLMEVEKLLNSRPRKVLDWLSPSEIIFKNAI